MPPICSALRPTFLPTTRFHLLTVKLASKRPGLTLHYRTGYLYNKEPATLKERFHQAVWLPVDANQVAVTAQPIAFAGGLRVKITVAAGDLALEEKSGRWSGNLDVFLVQRDDAGLQAQLEGKRLGLQLKNSTLQYLLKNGLSVERTCASEAVHHFTAHSFSRRKLGPHGLGHHSRLGLAGWALRMKMSFNLPPDAHGNRSV